MVDLANHVTSKPSIAKVNIHNADRPVLNIGPLGIVSREETAISRRFCAYLHQGSVFKNPLRQATIANSGINQDFPGTYFSPGFQIRR
ncbi:MAG: hypothetical protein HRU33_04395 [Rhodobacteraceae bacterium]|nr:hypothetical protein [Paracoccaceae bacterium]